MKFLFEYTEALIMLITPTEKPPKKVTYIVMFLMFSAIIVEWIIILT